MPETPEPAPAPALAPTSTSIPGSAILMLSLAAFLSGVSLRLTDALLPLFAREFSIPLGRAANAITAAIGTVRIAAQRAALEYLLCMSVSL